MKQVVIALLIAAALIGSVLVVTNSNEKSLGGVVNFFNRGF